jgi:hypothetical protein
MKFKRKNIGITILCIAISFVFQFCIHFLFFQNLGEWTFKSFSKFLEFQINVIDNLILLYFPLLFITPIVNKKLNYLKEMLCLTLVGIVSISLSLIAGVLIAVFTWMPDLSKSTLLPKYILSQPVSYYWTFFIIIGVLVPFLILMRKNRNKFNESKTID